MSDFSDEPHEKRIFQPSEYMRQRRPHLFSDTTVRSAPAIDRDTLSYHLESLTSRKDEGVFESFAKRLAEKFISPNIRPQTGPIGGGDGKTDAETHPVSRIVALRWWLPDIDAADQRFAFAFSAKKDWKAKVKADVASIAGTGRSYPRIIFITSRFAPAKDSAGIQDELEAQHGIPVTILDRTWILEKVFEGDSIDIAVEILGVGKGTEKAVPEIGPEDARRLGELEKLERRIADGAEYKVAPSALIEDCHTAALLARGVEKPRHEVDGRFLRAVRLAKEHSLPKLELAVTYDWAWTTYFWFDDVKTLSQLYEEVERLALPSDTSVDLERISNLLTLFHAAVRFGTISRDDAKLDQRTRSLDEALAAVRADGSRPNNALHAHALALMLRLTQYVNGTTVDPIDDGSLRALWDEFTEVIKDSKGLGTFPFEQMADTLTEVGHFVPECDEFDRLYEALTDAVVERRSEGEGAKRNCERAWQKLEKDLPYEAIRWFGRAVSLLVKAEYRHELIDALVGSSAAYEKAGLLWASRNYALAAVSMHCGEFQRSGSISDLSPRTLVRWLATEIQLGRIPYILDAYHMFMTVLSGRLPTARRDEVLSREQTRFGGVIGTLLLRTPFDVLGDVAKLPDGLERIGLLQARMALLHLMGQEDLLREEGSVPEEVPPEEYADFFDQFAAVGNELGVAETPDYLLSPSVILRSKVLGCEIEIVCDNNTTSISISESLLGTIECILATSLGHRMFPMVDKLRLRVRVVSEAGVAPKLTFADENGRSVGTVTHRGRLTYRTVEETRTYPDWLAKASTEIFQRLVQPDDLDGWGRTVIKQESGFSRAVTFSNVPNNIGVIFGDRSAPTIDEWIEEEDIRYDVLRDRAWKPSHRNTAEDKRNEPAVFGEGEPPEGMFDPERMRHSDFRVISPIDIEKWNAGKWRAVFFMTVDGNGPPPVMCLAFLNADPGRAIFESWQALYGLDDPDGNIRIAFIRRVRSSNPHAYAVIVGPDPNKLGEQSGNFFEFVSRYQVMTPDSSENLDRFLKSYEDHGRFLIGPAYLPSLTAAPRPMLETVLGKYSLVVREAWEIGENDPDSVVFDLDDPPVIPANQPNAPAKKALERLRTRRKSRP